MMSHLYLAFINTYIHKLLAFLWVLGFPILLVLNLDTFLLEGFRGTESKVLLPHSQWPC